MLTGNFNVVQLNVDTEKAVPSWVHKIGIEVRKINAPKYDSVSQLYKAIGAGAIRSGQLIRLRCTPTRFSPFKRNHFLSIGAGPRSDLRRGPRFQLGTQVHQMMGVMMQMFTHWAPVGILPCLGGGVYQATLLEPERPIFGTVSAIPIPLVGQTITPRINALCRGEHIQQFNATCVITGVLRHADQEHLESAGVTPEDYEVMRQQNSLYFIDCTDEHGDCVPHKEHNQPGLWGALYAEGHIEFEGGELDGPDMESAFFEAIKTCTTEDVHISRASGTAASSLIYSKGIRATLSHNSPVYSIHMDADVASEFKEKKEQFDHIIENSLNNTAQVIDKNNLKWTNQRDLDFNYANSHSSATLLRTAGHQASANPLITALTEWHQARTLDVSER